MRFSTATVALLLQTSLHLVQAQSQAGSFTAGTTTRNVESVPTSNIHPVPTMSPTSGDTSSFANSTVTTRNGGNSSATVTTPSGGSTAPGTVSSTSSQPAAAAFTAAPWNAALMVVGGLAVAMV